MTNVLPSSRTFKANAAEALANAQLQRALAGLPGGLVAQRTAAVAATPDFENLRTAGRDIRDHTLSNLDLYLEAFESRALAAGSVVHWATTAAGACRVIEGILASAGAKRVIKGKSIVSEEIGLNAHLATHGFNVIESDLGEYIIQNRGEAPSHIIAPAIHLTQSDVEADFRRLHRDLPANRVLDKPETLVTEARGVLREAFLKADAGITGANFLIAETGSAIIVTNEGNGDLTQTLPRLHIVLASIEKVVPTLDDLAVLLRLLGRSATGQDMTAYTTLTTGPKRPGDVDGPDACHIILLDNGRSEMLAGDLREALRCIRCGACMNHCPVYNAIGGHAYGWVVPGPIGAVLTPAHLGIADSAHLPNASTFCGRCETVCPVKIPLVGLMRHWREDAHTAGVASPSSRMALKFWVMLARRPRLYHLAARFAAAILAAAAGRHGHFKSFLLAKAWTKHRDLPAPEGRTFQRLWRKTNQGVPR